MYQEELVRLTLYDRCFSHKFHFEKPVTPLERESNPTGLLLMDLPTHLTQVLITVRRKAFAQSTMRTQIPICLSLDLMAWWDVPVVRICECTAIWSDLSFSSG